MQENDQDRKTLAIHEHMLDMSCTSKSLNTSIPEEIARKAVPDDYELQLKKKDEKIEELEEALRESVKITARREMVLTKQEAMRQNMEKQMRVLVVELEETKAILSLKLKKLAIAEASLHEKDRYFQRMKTDQIQDSENSERSLETRLEALLTAISEKDANIALLELTQSHKTRNTETICLLRKEKDGLVWQLKQQTQNCLKLIQSTDEQPQHNKVRSEPNNRKHDVDHMKDKDEEGTYA